MPSHYKFLIVDDNPDSRFLLVKTLLRKFPQAVLKETQDGDSSVTLARTEPLDAVVVHRAAEIDGVSLIRLIRQANSTVPIVMVSGIDRSKDAADAGASTFLSYEAWLRIGTVVAELIGSQSIASKAPTQPDVASAEA
jgi:DNA-binding response OmpR family regulator